jgi:hypothetical protein
MARIQIADLPLLKDLTPEQLKELFGAGPRAFKPSFEALEDRTLRSMTPLGGSLLANIQVNAAVMTAATTATQPANSLIQASVVNQQQIATVASQNLVPSLVPANPGPTGPGDLTPLNQPSQTSVSEQAAQAINAYVAANLDVLGQPVQPDGQVQNGQVHLMPDGVGYGQLFSINLGPNTLYSYVLWSPQTANFGAHAVTGPMLNKWLAVGQYLGYPTDDAPILFGNPVNQFSHVTQHFQGKAGVYGMITTLAYDGGTFAVNGLIYQAFLHGSVTRRDMESGTSVSLSPAAMDWVPISDVKFAANNTILYNLFQDPRGRTWVICWFQGDPQAQIMTEDIFNRWTGAGGVAGLGGLNYGRPDGNTTIYEYMKGDVYSQDFNGGPKIGTEFGATIVDTPWAGVHEIHGVVRDVWLGEHLTLFGFPISDEIDNVQSPYGIDWAINITLDPETGQEFQIYALDSYVGDDVPPDSWFAVDPSTLPAILPDGSSPFEIYKFWEQLGTTSQADTAAPSTSGPASYMAPGNVPGVAFVPQSEFVGSATSALPTSAFAPYDPTTAVASGSDLSALLSGDSTAQPTSLSPYAVDPWNFSTDFLASLVAGLPAQAPASDASQASPVADFTNVSFTVISDDGTVSHQLVIQSQSAHPDGNGGFFGVWDPANADGGQAVTGILASQADGTIHLIFTAADGSTFDSIVSGQAGTYHVDGTYTDATGNAVHFARDQDQVQPAAVTQVADLTNVSFTVNSDDGTVSHQLVIQSQVAQPDGSATFSGVWDPANADQAVTGTLASQADGTIHLIFTATDGSSLDSIVSGQAGAYHLDGTFTDATGNAMHFAGDQVQVQPAAVTQVADLTNVSFTVISDDGTVSHQLVIQSQAAQPDGSATFSGVWDPTNAGGGQAVTGTLVSQADGTIHLIFSAADGSSFDSIVSGQAGAYHVDGTLTPGDGSAAIHLAGDQDQPQPAAVTPVADFTNVSFSMTDASSAAYQLQIQTQVVQADGSATFMGVWFPPGSLAGQEISGTLAYDSTGNIQIVFSGGSVQFTGTIAGAAGSWSIDGTMVDSVYGTSLVTGGQTA